MTAGAFPAAARAAQEPQPAADRPREQRLLAARRARRQPRVPLAVAAQHGGRGEPHAAARDAPPGE